MGCKRKRVEDVRFTQGKGSMSTTSSCPECCSVTSSARLIRMRASPRSTRPKREGLPGVIAVLTADDLKPLNLPGCRRWPATCRMVLADGKVLFQNQEVAFVVAEDRYIADDATELVEVDYEELPVVSTRSRRWIRTPRSCARIWKARWKVPMARATTTTTSSQVAVGDKEATNAPSKPM
jgi:carbon-monoxide dehydrogenase large subunit